MGLLVKCVMVIFCLENLVGWVKIIVDQIQLKYNLNALSFDPLTLDLNKNILFL